MSKARSSRAFRKVPALLVALLAPLAPEAQAQAQRFAERQTIAAFDANTSRHFGHAIALAGDWLVVADTPVVSGTTIPRGLYFFRRSAAGSFDFAQKFDLVDLQEDVQPPGLDNTRSLDVDTDGNTTVVMGRALSGPLSMLIKVFVRNGSQWVESQSFVPSGVSDGAGCTFGQGRLVNQYVTVGPDAFAVRLPGSCTSAPTGGTEGTVIYRRTSAGTPFAFDAAFRDVGTNATSFSDDATRDMAQFTAAGALSFTRGANSGISRAVRGASGWTLGPALAPATAGSCGSIAPVARFSESGSRAVGLARTGCGAVGVLHEAGVPTAIFSLAYPGLGFPRLPTDTTGTSDYPTVAWVAGRILVAAERSTHFALALPSPGSSNAALGSLGRTLTLESSVMTGFSVGTGLLDDSCFGDLDVDGLRVVVSSTCANIQGINSAGAVKVYEFLDPVFANGFE